MRRLFRRVFGLASADAQLSRRFRVGEDRSWRNTTAGSKHVAGVRFEEGMCLRGEGSSRVLDTKPWAVAACEKHRAGLTWALHHR